MLQFLIEENVSVSVVKKKNDDDKKSDQSHTINVKPCSFLK